MHPFDPEVKATLEALRKGGTILYPTDTIWGLGCDATNKEVVNKIFEIKRREESKSLVTLIDDEAKLQRYVRRVPDQAWDLIEFTEKPLTIVYDEAVGLAPNVIAPDGSVAIRVTRDPFCKELIRRFGKAIVSTSANLSGESPPACFAGINPLILGAVDYVVNLRQNEPPGASPKPSTIIQLKSNGEFRFLRK